MLPKLESIQSGGAGVVVAVVDSGWTPTRAYSKVAPVIDVRDGLVEELSTTACDSPPHPHGVRCIGAILAIAPEAEVRPIRIFGHRLHARSETLLLGMRAALQCGARVINLSLVVDAFECRRPMEELCDEAEARGILVVAAARNRSGPSIPAEFTNVIGVQAIETASERQFAADPSRSIQCGAFGRIGRDSRNSYATATLSGIAALVGAHHRPDGCVEWRNLLYQYADPELLLDEKSLSSVA